MENFSAILQQDNGWLFIPSAILLGALHGLEPGHSKTMMAAFIVAIRGTVGQAIMLGLAATASHTAIVWLVAMLGLTYGQGWNSERTEPYLQIISAVLIICVALWVVWRARHEHLARLHLHSHHHSHHHAHGDDLLVHEDAHTREHEKQMRTYLAQKKVTNGQIILFGLSGGLIPCPAAITVLLLCLQLKKITLGAALVLCFSIGLAITLVVTGVLAAWGMRHATARWQSFNKLVVFAPYVSSTIIVLIGLYLGWSGWSHLAAL